jgi:hypothetical protein
MLIKKPHPYNFAGAMDEVFKGWGVVCKSSKKRPRHQGAIAGCTVPVTKFFATRFIIVIFV